MFSIGLKCSQYVLKDKVAPYALKGQKLLAQGNTLGKPQITMSPCKGKSFIVLCFKAFALTGRFSFHPTNPGRCPGLGASALSGRMGNLF